MLADGVEASVRSLSSRDEPAIRAMVNRIIERAAPGRAVRRVRPDPARHRADPRGVRLPAARDVPPANRLPAVEDRRARGSPARRGRRRWPGQRAARVGRWGLRPGREPARRSIADRGGLISRPGRTSAAGLVPSWRRLDRRGAGRGRRAPAGLDRADPGRRRRAGRPERAATWARPAPTDVLSFPLLPPEAFPAHPEPRRRPARPAGRGHQPGRPSPCRPADGCTSATSSSRSSGPSNRPRPVGAARPATCAGRRRRAAPPGDPRRAPRLRLGSRRASRGGLDARSRAAPARATRSGPA